MEFDVFGQLKRTIARQHLITKEEILKTGTEEWQILDLSVIKKALAE